jgi:hypothetical protein
MDLHYIHFKHKIIKSTKIKKFYEYEHEIYLGTYDNSSNKNFIIFYLIYLY